MTGRSYRFDNQDYPSVTTVLQVLNKPGLMRWFGRVGNDEADRISKDARELGTRIHRACETVNLEQDFPCDDNDLHTFVRAYYNWFTEHVAYVIGAEKVVVSHRWQYAGTADLVALLKGDDAPTVIDIKTSNYVGDEWPLQLAGYRLALAERGVTCARRMVVQIPSKKPGELHIHEYEDHDRDERAFRNALQLWRWADAKRPPKPEHMQIRFTRDGGRP
jgi:hypothetical protein